MSARKKRKRELSLRLRVISLISLTGPIGMKDMTKILAAPYQSLNTECLALQRLERLKKDSEGMWGLGSQAS